MTRVAQAKKGSISEEVRSVSKKEFLHPSILTASIAEGKVCIVRNKKRPIYPLVIGKNCRIKINANIGTSSSCNDIKLELEKMNVAIKFGADAIMDLSTAGDLQMIRKTMIAECPVAFGTVPLYEMAQRAQEKKKSILEISADEMFDVIEEHCEQGVDFLTLHCGVTERTVSRLKEVHRLTGAVSRGGTIIAEWIDKNKKENPLFEHYDRLLKICAHNDVAISLGDGFRPGSCADATDRVQIEELIILGELVKKARQSNVTVFVEGPGHVPLNQIVTNVQLEKRLCDDAPFYVLGPLVTDVSIGYDHIAGAIGGAVAGMAGVDFLCYVTPAEHLRLPTIDDVKEGVIASRIAAHAADISKDFAGALEWDNKISEAKKKLDWETLISLCIDPEKARTYRASVPLTSDSEGLCSMCGEFCAVKRSNTIA